MKKLDNKIVIVTGGASGIGKGIVREFARQGATVVSADIQVELGQRVVAEVVNAGGKAEFVETDLRDLKQIKALVDHTVATYGRLDVLIPNAGVQHEATLTETSEEQYDHVRNVNMKTGGGNIVAIGSVLSLVAEPALAAYCATKAGIMNLMKSITCDYGRRNIRANCVCPGYINTPLGDKYFELQPDPAAARQSANELHPLGRMGEIDEVAKCVAFLASDDADFVAGAALVIDGGLIAKV